MPRYRKVLLVDDHGVVREGAALYLRALDPDIEVFHAKSPEEGISQVQTHEPDLVFLDLCFEDVPDAGLKFLQWIKENPDYDHIPVIVMSGTPLDRNAVEGLLGKHAAGYIAKGKADSAEVFRVALMNLELGAVFIHGARPGAANAMAPSPPEPRSAASLGLR